MEIRAESLVPYSHSILFSLNPIPFPSSVCTFSRGFLRFSLVLFLSFSHECIPIPKICSFLPREDSRSLHWNHGFLSRFSPFLGHSAGLFSSFLRTLLPHPLRVPAFFPAFSSLSAISVSVPDLIIFLATSISDFSSS